MARAHFGLKRGPSSLHLGVRLREYPRRLVNKKCSLFERLDRQPTCGSPETNRAQVPDLVLVTGALHRQDKGSNVDRTRSQWSRIRIAPSESRPALPILDAAEAPRNASEEPF